MSIEIKFYEINEEAQRMGRSMWSFRDYVMGSTTKTYQEAVREAYRLAEEAAEENKKYAATLAERYSQRLANYYNKAAKIEMMCPSVAISGAGNFPVAKKEKQNLAKTKHFNEWDDLKVILKRLKELKTYTPKRAENQGKANAETFDNPFFKVVQNEEQNRLQLIFDGKPNESTRALLKENGYKWSPSNQAWQRQLTANARSNVRYIIEKLRRNNEN